MGLHCLLVSSDVTWIHIIKMAANTDKKVFSSGGHCNM